jgi:predicted dienelactone hydrolase
MFDNRRTRWLFVTAIIIPAVWGVGCGQVASISSDDTKGISQHRLGSFAIGHSVQLLHVIGTLGEDRPVNVELWYPAQASSNPTSVYTSRLNGTPLLPQWDPLSWEVGAESSQEDAPISQVGGPFPAIVFSHGHTNNAIDYGFTLENIASFGFVVAAPDHVGDTRDDVRIDFINSKAGFTLLPCFDGLAPPCTRSTAVVGVPKSMIDRMQDIREVLDALPTWFGNRVDVTHAGVLGHSRGTISALAAGGGSATWGFQSDPRVRAIMGLAIAVPSITFAVDLQNIAIPTLLVAGTLDRASPATTSEAAIEKIASVEKDLVLLDNVVHRSFDSTLCDQMQSSGAIAQANDRAILDRETASNVMGSGPIFGLAVDHCGFGSFTTPVDIRPLVTSITGFNVTPDNVPTTGVTSADVKRDVIELAVDFFSDVLERPDNDTHSLTNFLPVRFNGQTMPTVTQAALDAANQVPNGD